MVVAGSMSPTPVVGPLPTEVVFSDFVGMYVRVARVCLPIPNTTTSPSLKLTIS